LILLYISAPLLYIKNKLAERMMNLYETKAILLIPVLSFSIFALASLAMGGFPYGGIAPSVWIYCPEAGPGIGGTTSGGTVPFDPVCPESYSELYPMMWTITLISPLAQIIFILPLIAAFITAVVITRTTKEIFESGSESEQNEIRAVRLGFIGKTIFQLEFTRKPKSLGQGSIRSNLQGTRVRVRMLQFPLHHFHESDCNQYPFQSHLELIPCQLPCHW